MTANLTLDNTLYETVLKVASARGQTLDEFAAEAVQEAATNLIAVRDGLPCVVPPVGTPRIDPTQLRRLVEEGVF